MSEPLVALVTTWYRGGEHIDGFAAAVNALAYPSLRHVFVIHQLEPSEVTRLERLVPRASLITTGRNLGAAAGWNLGIRRAMEEHPSYVGILNPDTRPHPDCLGRQVAVLEGDRSIAACQPILLYSDEPSKVEMFGGSLDPTTGQCEHEYAGAALTDVLPAVRDAGYLDGGSILVRADVFRALGGFDERYFLYCEDSDLCLRIHQLGYRTVAVRDAWMWHYHRASRPGGTPPHEMFYTTRNQFYFVGKHGGRRAWAALLGRVIYKAPRTVLRHLRHGRGSLAWAYVSGIVYGVRGRMGQQGWVR